MITFKCKDLIATEQTKKLLYMIFNNEDGLPNEKRPCFTATDWAHIDLILKHDEIPTDSSHVYQCDECYQELEKRME